ncbi:MAG: hypothetical protein PVI78_08985 [Anaerolineales bacterium]|jgi:hypothetical protein
MTSQAGNEDPMATRKDKGMSIAMASIIAVTIVVVTAILACAATIIILIYNIPM